MTTVVVIGGGPGGYVAAIRAAQLGGTVTLVEKEKIGGTCLNVGCIPTKALLHAGEFFEDIQQASSYGINLELQGYDWSLTQAKKDKTVAGLTRGVAALLKANGVTVIYGNARLLSGRTISVTNASGMDTVISADKVIIAVGSVAYIPPIPGLISPHCVTSTEALSLSTVPKTMVIIGGGVIGLELGSVYHNFGTTVTIVEALPQILPSMDSELGEMLQQMLQRNGIEIYTGAKVISIGNNADVAAVEVEVCNEKRTFEAEVVLVATGRRPNTQSLGLEDIGVEVENGSIKVNTFLETTIKGIYAVGDCLGQVMLAHVASAQGEVAATNALGGAEKYENAVIPSCVYTNPEFAEVGLTESHAKELGLDYSVDKFPLYANGKALIMNGGKGVVKLITNSDGSLLGSQILGPSATEIIGECALAIKMGATAGDLIRTIHAHPTIYEAIREAALVSEHRPIHTL